MVLVYYQNLECICTEVGLYSQIYTHQGVY
jgi:hypothetical protein